MSATTSVAERYLFAVESFTEFARTLDVDDLLARWSQQAPAFAQAIEQMGEGRPPVDCHSHEHDIRHALGRPGARWFSFGPSPSPIDE